MILLHNFERDTMKKHSLRMIILFATVISTMLLLSACHREHSFGQWIVELEPTCTQNGIRTRVCECGEEERVDIPSKGHTVTDWFVDIEANCTHMGTEKQICSVCDVVLQTKELSALGHTPGNWIILTESTCVANGMQYQECATCKVTLQVASLDLGEHKAGKWFIDYSPTSTEEGLKHQVCSLCNETIKTEVLPPVPDYYIILDAGHGGKDRGASVDDVLEKEINLQITYKLRELLEARGAYIILTRQDDTYIALEDRSSFANLHSADLFISIHCNSYMEDASVAGLEIYYYQNRTAKSIADDILSALKETGQFATRNVKPEEFYVLMHTDMPAILVELGFMTNQEELQNLCDEAYQYALAEAMADSIIASLS